MSFGFHMYSLTDRDRQEEREGGREREGHVHWAFSGVLTIMMGWVSILYRIGVAFAFSIWERESLQNGGWLGILGVSQCILWMGSTGLVA